MIKLDEAEFDVKMQIEEDVGRRHQNYMYTLKKKPEFYCK